MLSKVIKTVFGSRNDRIIKKLKQRVQQINKLEPSMQALDDAALAAKTDEFRQRYADGETLEQLLDEAFAVCREAAVRTLDMRHYDVQLVGGMILHNNQITEMRTGEGKTLVATLPAYLNAISGLGVHIVTVNDYLAERDAEWMGQIYEFLGLTVGVVLSTMDYATKRESYKADITYGTNNQFGFDYMHDNLCFSLDERVQRELNYAIVDEVDSIPDRRGANSVDHFRAGQRQLRSLYPHQRDRTAPGKGSKPRKVRVITPSTKSPSKPF